MRYVICKPGIPRTGEPPSFKLAVPRWVQHQGRVITVGWMSPDHGDWGKFNILTFDNQEDACKWLVEYVIQKPVPDPEWAEYSVDELVVEERYLTDWKKYKG